MCCIIDGNVYINLLESTTPGRHVVIVAVIVVVYLGHVRGGGDRVGAGGGRQPVVLALAVRLLVGAQAVQVAVEAPRVAQRLQHLGGGRGAGGGGERRGGRTEIIQTIESRSVQAG